jgi:hypothetical protein
LAFLLLLNSCASHYQAPPEDEQSSVPITFVNYGPGAAVFIRKSPEACSTIAEAGLVGIVGTTRSQFVTPKYEIKSRLQVDVPSTISMGWWAAGPIRECGEKITFTPVAGTEYQVVYVADFKTRLGLSNVTSCEVRVLSRPNRSNSQFTPFNGAVQRTRENICIR